MEQAVYVRVRRRWMVSLSVFLWTRLGWMFPAVDTEALSDAISRYAIVEYRTSKSGSWKRAN